MRHPTDSWRSLVMRTALVLSALSHGGCVLEDGRGFARLSGNLWAGFTGLDAAAGRVLAGGWFRTDTDYELQPSILTIELGEIVLSSEHAGEASGGATTCTVDPAHPPAGCTSCHGEHCHCDGQLKSLDELRAELCGGAPAPAAAAASLARLPVAEPLSLLGAGTRIDLRRCDPSCELGAGELEEGDVTLQRLQLQGTLRDASGADRLTGAEPPVRIDLDLAGHHLPFRLSTPEPLGRDHPHLVDLALELPVTEQLLDGLEWYVLERGEGVILIDGVRNHQVVEKILANLALTQVRITATRGEE